MYDNTGEFLRIIRKQFMSDTINVYKARFYGKKVGSIGLPSPYVTTVTGINRQDAELRLYDRFEHISGLDMRLEAVEPREKFPEFEDTQRNTHERK
jgi:hypothetical protein